MDLQQLINSRIGVGAGYVAGRLLPPKYGYRISEWLGVWLATKKTLPMVQAVRANQWVVSGGKLTGARLDAIVQETYRNNARSIYEIYRYLEEPGQLAGKVENIADLLSIIEEMKEQKRGLLALGVHMANFDLLLLAAIRGTRIYEAFDGVAISVPQPGGGYQWQNKYREVTGFRILPASIDAMNQAIKALTNGGFVVTGVDRPFVGDHKIKPVFFNRPSALPVSYISLAIKTQAMVIVFGGFANPDGTYKVLISNPISIRRKNNHQDTLRYNAEAVLHSAEEFIRSAPSQWTMPYPVWPDVTQEMIERHVEQPAI